VRIVRGVTMPIKEQQAFDGKAAEHIVISELLKRNMEPFIPVLDRGIDIVVKSKKLGLYYELQVKSNNSPIKENQKWFVFSGDLQIRENLIYVLVDMISNDIWIIPSEVVKEHGNQCKTQFDLHLQHKIKRKGDTRELLLQAYKNNWVLLE